MNFSEFFGQVCYSSGHGRSGLRVVIDGKISRTTDRWGFFKFEVLKSGTHRIKLYNAGKCIYDKEVDINNKWERLLIKTNKKDNNPKKDGLEKIKKISNSHDVISLSTANKESDYWSDTNKERFSKKGSIPYFLEKNKEKMPEKIDHSIKLSGKIIDDRSGLPIMGALVKIGNYSAVTDEDGEYKILIKSSLPFSKKVTITREGYTLFESKVEIKKNFQKMDYIIIPEGGTD